jgi:hypothetical protein
MPDALIRDPVTQLHAEFGAGFLAPPGYIDGLQMGWNSVGSISVSSGSCYIPSLGYALPFPSTLTLSSLSLTASTFYHLYGYSNSGTPAIELVTTAPSAPYNGTARTKTGDTSRRYLGSILTTTGGNIVNFVHTNDQVNYRTAIGSAPFVILSNGRATAGTNVSCATVVPTTAVQAILFLYNDPTTGTTVLYAASDGASVPTGYEGFVASAAQLAFNVRLDSTQSFSYAYQSAPSGSAGFTVRVSGYVFER